MWNIGPNVSCILVKRSENEVKFIRSAQGRVLSVIQRHIGNNVGGHRNTEAQVAMLKPSQKGSCELDLMHAYCVMDVVDVYDKYPNFTYKWYQSGRVACDQWN